VKNLSKKQMLMTTLLSAVTIGAFAAPAQAQDVDDEEIVVTGSRIAKKDFISNSPIATVDAVQFERTFSVNTENLLNTLPQTVPGLDRTSNNPGNGSATVDLRGLGANRTLVLVNGTRQIPFGQNGVVDLNTIPTSLIENVQVLTGGASSVYGADAVSGVVNFILKDDFEGVETNIGYSITEQGDAGLLNVDATFGANLDDGRGNVVFNASYANREALFQGDREFSNTALFNNAAGDGLEPGGSSGVPGTSIFNGGLNGTESCGVQLGARFAADTTIGTDMFSQGDLIPCPEGQLTANAGAFANGASIFNSDGTARDFILGGDVNDFYNYAPVNFIQLPQERFTLTSLGSYEINEKLELYARGSFSQNRIESQLAPTPIFQNSTFSLDGNPFIDPAAQAAFSGNNTDQIGIGARQSRILADPTAGFNPTPRNLDADLNPILPGSSDFVAQNLCVNCVFDSDGDGFNDVAPLFDTDGDGIADTATALVRRRLEEVGPRQTVDINDAFQITIGARGDLTDTWSYDVYLQEGRTVRAQTQNGNVNRGRFDQALLLSGANGEDLSPAGSPLDDGIESADDGGQVTLDASGNATCDDSASNGGVGSCTPLNIFGPGNISADAATFISTAAAATSEFEQTVLQGNLSGDLGSLSFTDDPIGVAIGAEYIELEADFRPSQDIAASTIAGFNGSPPSGGRYEVSSVYGELSVPLVSGLPFAERITLDLAGRYSDYSTSGGAEAYKIGGEWAFNDQFRVRGNYNRAVRAPNIQELFAPVAENFPSAVDPCSAAGNPDAAVTAICTATGVPANQVGAASINTISGQVRTLAGGNDQLDVETADTFTIGAVIQPSFLEGLSVTVDYYDITINDAIAAFGGGANNVLQTCFTDTVNGGVGSQFCDVINRRPDGSIDFISLQDQNVASIEAQGIDIQASYAFDAGNFGDFNINYLGTYNLQNDFTAFEGADVITCDGEFGTTCGEPDPTYRHRVVGTLNKDDWSFQTVWRLVGGVDDDAGEGVNFVDSIGAFHYFNSSISKDIGDNVTLTFGANNLFDRDPPVIGDNDEQANTFPATYDVFGRTYFANAKVRF